MPRQQNGGMPSPRDAFLAFVDMLAEHLDDLEMRGPDLAARAFMSRYHFDRVIRAAAGETPTRFRRRILLERSAFRLRTTDLSILSVAAEAGYSSHEAFTRAFQRAYGVLPSVWRAAPGPIQLDCPNGVHFHPPGGLRLPPRDEAITMDLTVTMVEHHVWLLGELLDRATGLTDRQLDAPIELSVEGIDDHPTIRSLLSRLVGQMDMWNASVASRAYDFGVERGESLASMRSRLADAGTTFVAQVRDVCRHNRLDETFVDATCEPPRVFTYGGMIAHVLTYAAHRRTIVVGALESAGAPAVDDDPLTWLAPAT